jgi:hypothetical protein
MVEIFSAIIIVVPIIVPVALQYGIDPVHLGVIFLLNLEIGYLTPPVGLNLFVTAFRFNKPIADVVRASMPFLLLMLGALMLVTYVPSLTVVKDKPKQEEGGGGAQAVDAGAISITLDDGGVWTPERCSKVPEIAEDPLAKAECEAMFTLYAKCDTLEDQTEKVLCQSDVLDGKDPFSDEEEEEEPEDEPAEDVDAGPSDADAAP